MKIYRFDIMIIVLVLAVLYRWQRGNDEASDWIWCKCECRGQWEMDTSSCCCYVWTSAPGSVPHKSVRIYWQNLPVKQRMCFFCAWFMTNFVMIPDLISQTFWVVRFLHFFHVTMATVYINVPWLTTYCSTYASKSEAESIELTLRV